VSRDARGVILGLVAVMLLRLSITDEYLLYVKPSMRPWLLVSGSLLAVLAVVDVLGLMARPGHAPAQGDDHHHDHEADDGDDHHGHRHGLLPWILVIPSVVVFSIGPSPLGAFMAERQSTTARDPGQDAGGADTSGTDVQYSYPALAPPVDGAVEMTIGEFIGRAAFDRERQMEDVRVRLIGFVSPDPEGNGETFLLTRFALSCCAADAVAVSVRAQGLSPIPAGDTWLEVEGFWIPHTGDELPPYDAFDIVAAREIPVPEHPYL
jgi:putative membrane protein